MGRAWEGSGWVRDRKVTRSRPWELKPDLKHADSKQHPEIAHPVHKARFHSTTPEFVYRPYGAFFNVHVLFRQQSRENCFVKPQAQVVRTAGNKNQNRLKGENATGNTSLYQVLDLIWRESMTI